jgi:hypothetical protein
MRRVDILSIINDISYTYNDVKNITWQAKAWAPALLGAGSHCRPAQGRAKACGLNTRRLERSRSAGAEMIDRHSGAREA